MAIVATHVINIGTGTRGPSQVIEEVMQKANITQEEILYTVVTGYGRVTFQQANAQITEISCHAKGVSYLMKGIRTIIDIGGQDAKVIRIEADGRVKNFVMNEKCAAGTGRFLEVMARVLGCDISELSDLADSATNDIPISSVCTVFAESEVISRLASGASVEDVARGAHLSIAKRIVGMCNRVGFEADITMTGGVALNKNVVKVLSEELNMEIKAAPETQAVGAIGAAVFAYERHNKQD
jgi:predicted CoA-substrate-specific enzyme activase